MEWNKDLYTLCDSGDNCSRCSKLYNNGCDKYAQNLYRHGVSPRYARRDEELMKSADVWNEISPLVGAKDINVWRFDPIQFRDHIDRMKLDLSFNPYAGTQTVSFPRDKTKRAYWPYEAATIEFIDNPGFAPVANGTTKYVHDGVSFAEPTSPYGIYRWGAGQRRGDQHTGVDLAPGEKNTDIQALIHGQVWVCSKNEMRGYGNVMILKNTNEDLLFLLAHLYSFEKKDGDFFEPGEVVAKTGNTTGGLGTSTGIHLHVEVFLCAEKNREKILDLLYITEKKGTARDQFFNDHVALYQNRVDPFHHSLSTHRV
jgi:hypothetical protein